jgi:hypothetical protein
MTKKKTTKKIVKVKGFKRSKPGGTYKTVNVRPHRRVKKK